MSLKQQITNTVKPADKRIKLKLTHHGIERDIERGHIMAQANDVEVAQVLQSALQKRPRIILKTSLNQANDDELAQAVESALDKRPRIILRTGLDQAYLQPFIRKYGDNGRPTSEFVELWNDVLAVLREAGNALELQDRNLAFALQAVELDVRARVLDRMELMEWAFQVREANGEAEPAINVKQEPES